MTRRGTTILELVVGFALLTVLIAIAVGCSNLLNRQSRRAFDSLGQAQEVTLLLENIRLELASMVMNPTEDARAHENNSFVISQPNRTSIQFVTERREGGERRRFLVYYEAKDAVAGGGLTLTKTVWEFRNMGSWNNPIEFPAGWPPEWIGPVAEHHVTRFAALRLSDIQWTYLAPDEKEGRVFFRIKLAVISAGGRLVPFTTLVAVPTPDLPTAVSDCPCMFAACYDPATKNCDCCTAGSQP